MEYVYFFSAPVVAALLIWVFMGAMKAKKARAESEKLRKQMEALKVELGHCQGQLDEARAMLQAGDGDPIEQAVTALVGKSDKKWLRFLGVFGTRMALSYWKKRKAK